MTAQEWDVGKSVLAMYEALTEPVNPRRLRLWGAACARSLLGRPVPTGGFHDLPQWISDGEWLPLIEAVEAFADRRITAAKLEAIRRTTDPGPHKVFGSVAQTRRFSGRSVVVNWICFSNEHSAPFQSELDSSFREIFGNPFRPVAFDPSWRTSTAVAIAKTMYESREFAAMPLLADALEDSGCPHTDILDHCRSPGLHVRGCWVVDLVLGKS